MRLKQAELGKALGLPQGYISQVESGKHDIKLSTMQDWARVLGFELMLIPIAEVKSISYLLEANTTELLPPAYGPLPEHPQ
jgi:transcriptional regulator with XRE-family HTH domain